MKTLKNMPSKAKDTRHKRVYTVFFYLYEVLEQENYFFKLNKNSGFLEGRSRRRFTRKGHEGNFWGDGSVLYLIRL